MSRLKEKLNITNITIIAAFLYLAFSPYCLSFLYNMINGVPFRYFVEAFFSSIFNLSNVFNFLACGVIIVGIFTKFEKFTAAGGTLLYWFSLVISFFVSIINAVSYKYSLSASLILKHLANGFLYFIIFLVLAAYLLFDLLKKPVPDFMKYVALVPAAILLIVFVFAFLGNTIDLLRYLISDLDSFSDFIFMLSTSFFSTLTSLIKSVGFSVLLLKISGFKFKKKVKE